MSTDEGLVQCPICQETSPQGYLLCPFCGADLTANIEEKFFTPVTYKEAWFRFKSLFTRPREITEEIADNPDSKTGFLLLFVISFGLAFKIFSILTHNHLFDWRLPLIFLLTWIFSLLIPLVIWLVGSLFIRILSKLLGGKANRKQIRSAVGYGMMPIALAELINGILYMITLPWNDSDVLDYLLIFQEIISFRDTFAGIFGIILSSIAFVVGGVYIILIIKPANDFSWLEAGIAAGIPVIIFMVLLLTYYFAT